MKLRTLGILAAVVASVGLSAARVKANTIQLDVTGESGTTFTYSVYLTSGNSLSSTSSATVNPTDFASGLIVPDIGASAMTFAPQALGVTWTWNDTDMTGVATLGNNDSTSVSNSAGNTTLYSSVHPGSTVGSIATTDSSTIADLVFAVTSGTYTNSGSSRVLLGTGTFTSLITPSALSQVLEVSRNIGSVDSQQIVDSYNLVAVPVPAAAWTGMTSLLAVGGLSLLRRRRLA